MKAESLKFQKELNKLGAYYSLDVKPWGKCYVLLHLEHENPWYHCVAWVSDFTILSAMKKMDGIVKKILTKEKNMVE